jgi:hypothetical protein
VIYTRIGAAIFVLVLMGAFAFAGIAAVAWLGPMVTHGTNVMHVGGTILHVGPDKNFVFQTETDEQLAFVCNTNCQASLRHLLRHLKEKAHTDVYYVEAPSHELLAIDVD